MTTLAAIGGEGFAACSWVCLRPESAPRRKQRQCGSNVNDGDAGTRNGNNIEDGGGKSGQWTAQRATGTGGGEEETVMTSLAVSPPPTPPSRRTGGSGKGNYDDVSGNDANKR